MKWLVFLLLLLLGISNVFWLYVVVDQGVTSSYQHQQIDQLNRTQEQLMAALPELAGTLTQAQVIDAVSRHSDEAPYEKDGCVWVGWLGLKFAGNGRLQAVAPVWSYAHDGPCL